MGFNIVEVKNRTNKPYEFMYDGQVHIVPARDTAILPKEVAEHGIRKSIISYNPVTMMSVRALCLANSEEAEIDIDAREEGSELIDRSDDVEKFQVKKFPNPDMRGARVTSSLDGV